MAFQSHAPGHRGQSPPSAARDRLSRLFTALAGRFRQSIGSEAPTGPRPPRFPISGSPDTARSQTPCPTGREQPYTDLRAIDRHLGLALHALGDLPMSELVEMSGATFAARREAMHHVAIAGCHLDPRDFEPLNRDESSTPSTAYSDPVSQALR